MPKELPGFYFDEEKNRYFPIKGPIPGSKRPIPSSSSSSPEPSKRNQDQLKHKEDRALGLNCFKLLHARELHGGVFTSNKYTHSFKQEYEKLQASHPMVWKYQNTECDADTALEQVHGVFQTPTGLHIRSLLTMGCKNGSISLYEVGAVKAYYDYAKYRAETVWPPPSRPKSWKDSALASVWCLAKPLASYSSRVSCIKKIGKDSADNCFFHHALVTTLGSGVSGGSLYILNLLEPLDASLTYTNSNDRISKIVSFDHTVWTADCNSQGTEAVTGTNHGASLVNLETQKVSWIYRTKSDIFSQQFDNSGKVVLCGLRNGTIIAVDVREKQSRSSQETAGRLGMQNTRGTFHALPHRNAKRSSREISQHSARLNISNAVHMPSAVCSLAVLHSDDRYFLGSSMDGSIKLFDLRLLQRGAVQTYAGHVNSHTHLQLGVNPSESLVMSGGEDCSVRIWSIKTGKLIFEENVSNSIHRTICWPRSGYDLFGQFFIPLKILTFCFLLVYLLLMIRVLQGRKELVDNQNTKVLMIRLIVGQHG